MLLIGYSSDRHPLRAAAVETRSVDSCGPSISLCCYHLKFAYRWFCRLDLADPVPYHSTFSKDWNGRLRDSDLLQRLFKATV